MDEKATVTQNAVQIDAHVASPKHKEEFPESSAFECNICYDLAQSPVVTMCGHLYCWPCLYRWMQVQNHCRVCPVCKAGIEQDKVIPIYGRGGDNTDPRQKAQSTGSKEEDKDGPVPRRPAGQRLAPVPRAGISQQSGSVNLQPGLGILPTLFGMQQAPGQGGFAEPLTAEQQHQAFLSRLLLMLGSFVIMCLLLF
ncbi:g1823 [Coccomyxa elongata]